MWGSICMNSKLFIIFIIFQVVVLLIGTNNHHSSADQIAEGIEVIVWSITSKLPSAKVIVLVRIKTKNVLFHPR